MNIIKNSILDIWNGLKVLYAQAITKQFKISLLMLVYLLIIYALLRLGFFLVNHQFFQGVGTGEILKSFVYGLRFDISGILMLNGLLFIIYNFPGNPARIKWVKITLFVLFCALNIIGIILNLADYGYFPTIQRRMMSELSSIMPDIIRMIPGLLVEYYWLVMILIVVAVLFVVTSRRLLRALHRRWDYRVNLVNLAREGIWFILIGGLLIIGMRGGLQSRPIRQVDALSGNRSVDSVGYLTLNSTFTVLRSLVQPTIVRSHFLPEDEAVSRITEMFKADNERMIDPHYPFLREKTFPAKPQRKNIVIFIMESWAADYVGTLSGGESDMPFFDRLSAQGMLFTNFLANGQRSMVADSCILTSIPGFYADTVSGVRRSIIGSQEELNHFLGLGTILRKQGYGSSFHHGARTGSMGFNGYAKVAGFLNYYGKEDYPNLTDEIQDGTWGIYDEEFFQDFARRMDGFKPPFCAVVFSLSSHDPFKIPPRLQARFVEPAGDNKLEQFRRALRYSDYSLEQFFKTAETKPWFRDTIFLITGDHTNFARQNFHSYFHIPLLIYAPGVITPQRISRVGSQVDIIPTILDLLQISTVHASMGRSLLDTTKPHYEVVTDGARYSIFSDNWVLRYDLEKTYELYDYLKDPLLQNDLQSEQKEVAERLKQSLLAYIQETSRAIAEDRICRPADMK